MADIKISALPAATTPLSGTEELPIVQSGTTVKATAQDIADLGGGGGLAVPTFTVTPALPSWLNLIYKPANGLEMDAVQTVPTKYGIDINNNLSYYYQYNKMTVPFSTDAESVGSNILALYNTGFCDATITSLNQPTIKTILPQAPFNLFGSLFLDNSNLTTVNFSGLVACGDINFYNVSSVTSFDFSSLQYLDGSTAILCTSDYLLATTLSFPSLLSCNGSISIIQSTTGLTDLLFPSLIFFNGMNLNLTVPTSTTSIDLSSLTYAGNVSTFNITASSLTTFSMPLLKQWLNGSTITFNTALDQTSVDSILVTFAALDGTAGTSLFSSGILTIAGSNSAPSVTGYAAAATLTGRGVSVTTN